MVDPDRRPLEADETLVDGRKPGKRGRGAAGKTIAAGAIEAAPGAPRKRELGRLRLATVGYAHHAIDLARSWGEAGQRLPAVHLVFGLVER